MTFTQNKKSSLSDKLRNSSYCTNIVYFQKLIKHARADKVPYKKVYSCAKM